MLITRVQSMGEKEDIKGKGVAESLLTFAQTVSIVYTYKRRGGGVARIIHIRL